MAVSCRWTNRTCRTPQARITSRLIDSLYTEAMLLADEARSYFDDAGARRAVDARAVRPGRLRLRIAQGHDADHAHRRLAADPARDRIGRNCQAAKAAGPNAGSAMPRTAIRCWSSQLAAIRAAADQRQRPTSTPGSSGSTRAALEDRSAAEPGAGADGPARAWTRRAERLTRRPMRPFTFNPGPGFSPDPTRLRRVADKLPPGPCLFVTDRGA